MVSGGCIWLLISPDQEQLHGIDENERCVVKDHCGFVNDDHARQQAGTGDQDQYEGDRGQVIHPLCSYRFGELGNAGEHPGGGADPTEEL